MMELPESKPRIVIMKFGALGDVAMTLPAVGAIKSIVPESEITWVVGEASRPLIEGLRGLDKIVTVRESNLYSKNPLLRILELRKLSKNLEKRYALALIGHRSVAYTVGLGLVTDAPIAQLVRGVQNPALGLIRRGVVVPPMSLQESLALKKLVEEGLTRFQGGDRPVLDWVWDFSHIPRSGFELSSDFIAIHLGGGENTKTEFRLKRWPHMGELVQRTLDTMTSDVVLVGAPSEARDAQNLIERLNDKVSTRARIKNLVGKTTIPELVDVLRRARVFVGPDSGPLHIADHLEVPSVGIYGPTSPVSWGLLGARSKAVFENPSCRPCYRDDAHFPECPNEHVCMVGLSVDRVIEELRNVVPELGHLLESSDHV